MKAYVCFDDTDSTDSDRGTGRLARAFAEHLPDACRLWGVVRQQLLMDSRIPYTSHNSSACVIIDAPDESVRAALIAAAAGHLQRNFIAGSDPGVCVALENDQALPELMDFGIACTERIVSQKEARAAGRGIHLSGHGGTNDGIIGAAAGVGLTLYGWTGRFIEWKGLRDMPSRTTVAELQGLGIRVVSIDRSSFTPAANDNVDNKGWLRPRLWGGTPVLPVTPRGEGLWETLDKSKGVKNAG
ncbi:MAG: hypothetical protein PHY31_05580 [Smithellaceae bacterium]|nr:hypothetical protein [Smithellaceae bacterium]